MYVGYDKNAGGGDTSTRGGGLSVLRQGSIELTPRHKRRFGYTVTCGITLTIVRHAASAIVQHRDQAGRSVLYRSRLRDVLQDSGMCLV